MNRGRRPLRLEGVEEIVCDRHDRDVLAKVPAQEWDAVVDFCGYRPEEIDIVLDNLPGTIRQYIFISTATIHQNSVSLPMNEGTPMLTGPLPGPGGDYGYNKWLCELRLKERCEAKGIPHVSLRPVFIYGKYNYAPRESYFFKLMAKGERIVLPLPPQALFSMVSVWDVARACIACISDQRVFNKAYTVAGEELVSYDSLIEALKEVSGKPLQVDRKPLQFIAASGLPLPFPLDEHLVYSGRLLSETLDYCYMPLVEGMGKTYEWFSKATRA